ncbi:MAG: family 16 glycosylhydrolase [Clostridiales bacterium]|nr:family 16 glycosylhydrolase [Clostridiales bacterium]
MENLGSYTGINDKIVDFSIADGRELFRASSGYGNGGMFDCVWSGNNAEHDGAKGALKLKLTGDSNMVYGAEYQSYNTYGYGYYSVRMKPIKREGVVSSFFTYVGWPQWDEIDIEFLGKDTTKVQFNYFTNGVGKHEKLINLGFDASEGYHEYGFKWEEDKITWYVDGKGVYKATANIPTHDTKIMMNVWNGKSEGDNSVKGWLGTFDKNNIGELTAEYKWVGYRPI